MQLKFYLSSIHTFPVVGWIRRIENKAQVHVNIQPTLQQHVAIKESLSKICCKFLSENVKIALHISFSSQVAIDISLIRFILLCGQIHLNITYV